MNGKKTNIACELAWDKLCKSCAQTLYSKAEMRQPL